MGSGRDCISCKTSDFGNLIWIGHLDETGLAKIPPNDHTTGRKFRRPVISNSGLSDRRSYELVVRHPHPDPFPRIARNFIHGPTPFSNVRIRLRNPP